MAQRETDVRESKIQQAQVFLSDPRIRGTDLNKATQFLRSKGVTDDEIQQALVRSNFTRPSAHFNYHSLHPGMTGNPIPKRSSSWWPLILGVVAATAIYSAGREIIRQYLLPLYLSDFTEPQNAAVTTARQNTPHSEMRRMSEAYDQKIARLTDRVEELTESCHRATDAIQRLAQRIETTQIKDTRAAQAIDNLQRAVYTLSSMMHPRRQRHALDASHNESADGLAETSSVAVVDTSSVFGSDDVDTNASIYSSDRTTSANREPQDAFFNVTPARVLPNWRCLSSTRSSADGCVSTTSVTEGVRNIVESNGPDNRPPGENPGGTVVKSAGTTNTENADVYKEAVSDEGDEAECAVSSAWKGSGKKIATARELFEPDVFGESAAYGDTKTLVTVTGELRPASMPTMDAPLSDID